MGYCVDQGIPHSIFLGRVQEADEPYWLEEDRIKVLTYLQHKSEICPSCGTKNSDWVDENSRLLDEPKYEASTYTCFGCRELDRMRATVPDDMKGVYVIPKYFIPGEVPEIIVREHEAAIRKRIEALMKQFDVPWEIAEQMYNNQSMG